MKTCIYCKKQFTEKSREHVIPRGFGTFGDNTWTLDCVCGDCNNLFGRTLDIQLTRDSLEGVHRYNILNKKSSENYRNQNIKFILPSDFEIEELRFAIVWLNHKSGEIQFPPPAQIGFWQEKNKRYKYFLEEELDNVDLKKDDLTKKGMKMFASNDEEYKKIKGRAETLFGYQEKENFFIHHSRLGNLEKLIKVNIEGKITPLLRRAITKIVFNFLAKCISSEFVLQNGFDEARSFILNSGKEPKIEVSNDPILHDESKEFRKKLEGFLIVAENKNGKIVCSIQFYHLFTYTITLSESLKLDRDYGYAFLVDQAPQELFQPTHLQRAGFIIPRFY